MRQTNRLKPLLAALVCAAGAAGATMPATVRAQQDPGPVVARVQPTKGNEVHGSIAFTPYGTDRVRVSVALAGLDPHSVHGLHIHEKGDCSAPDASSAGGHFNPGGTRHGARSGSPRHAGDLGNITAGPDGAVAATFVVSGFKLDRSETGIEGRSVIVHANQDDLKSQPAGDAGPRIGCGLIGLEEAARAGSGTSGS